MGKSQQRKIVEMHQEVERLQHNLMVTSQTKADFQALAKRRLEEIQRLRCLFDEPLRVIAVEAIREVTGCPDIKGNDKYLVDVLMEKARDWMTHNAEVTGAPRHEPNKE